MTPQWSIYFYCCTAFLLYREFVWLCIYLQSWGSCSFVQLTRTSQVFNSTAACILYTRVDSQVQGVVYWNEKTPGARWLLHGWLRQAKRRGMTLASTAHTLLLSGKSHQLCCDVLFDRKRRRRRRKQRSSRRMKRAGQRSLKDQREPRPAHTARQPIAGLYRKRWRRRRGRSSWTSTPGSTKIHRKNVSCTFIYIF